MRELSPLAIFLGIAIGLVFGAANAYIGLKVGMTVAASIPAAVISMAIIRGLLKRKSILENNIVQTIASTGEAVAAGMIFTIPALFIFAQVDHDDSMRPNLLEMTLWGTVGGLLGVLFMIPLRRVLIVKEHGKLLFPEGVACAEVLEAGERGGVGARTVFTGLAVGGVYEFFKQLGLWAENAVQRLPLLRTQVGIAAEPALVGVGYILGMRVAGYMLGGAVLGWFVLIPAMYYFGGDTVIAPSKVAISQMAPGDIHGKYLRYIGAGAVVLAGLFSLIRSLRTIGSSFMHMAGALGRRGPVERTDRDIPIWALLLGLVAIGLAMWFLPQLHTERNLAVIVCVIVFSFFFVSVSSRLVGIVGGSSNPISGMTIATLLGTALVAVYLLDMKGPTAKVSILAVGALVCIAAANAGDTSQDLKTGFLIKATPWKQQVGEIIGVLSSTLVMALVIILIDKHYGFVSDAAHPNAVLAPQANLMKLLVQGIVDHQLPWALVLCGIAVALAIELFGMNSLPIAIGLYLPFNLSAAIMVGAVIRGISDWRCGQRREGENPGILGASGLVAGQGLMGVIMVIATALIAWLGPNFLKGEDPRFIPPGVTEPESVVTRHFLPWLSYKWNFDAEYGLKPTDSGDYFRGPYALDLYNWLPLVPLLLVGLWLLVTSMRRGAFEDTPVLVPVGPDEPRSRFGEPRAGPPDEIAIHEVDDVPLEEPEVKGFDPPDGGRRL